MLNSSRSLQVLAEMGNGGGMNFASFIAYTPIKRYSERITMWDVGALVKVLRWCCCEERVSREVSTWIRIIFIIRYIFCSMCKGR